MSIDLSGEMEVEKYEDHGKSVRVRFGGKTPAEIVRDESNVSARECLAIRALAGDGWSSGELCLALERKSSTIAKHRDGNCHHDLPHAPAAASD